MHKNAELKIIDRPDTMLSESERRFDGFCTTIESYFNNKVLDAIESLSIVVIFNASPEKILRGVPERIDLKSNQWIVNYPQDNNLKREIQQKTMRGYIANLRNAFDNDDNVTSVDIIMLYNKPLSALRIDRMKTKPSEESNHHTVLSFFPTAPKYKLDRVVLNEDLLYSIKKTLKIIQKFELIFDVWGYGEIEPAPKAILNFYGPPGTGKTMAAHGIAEFMKSNIMALNYADIESKFVGEAPKNLVKAFETAQNEKAVLFFDEADSFLGKRISNVTSNADQSVNSLRSQMLILLDNFKGIVIFATNLIENYDSAFESRIFRHLFFDMPNATNRKKIISMSIPEKVPYEDGNGITAEQLDDLVQLSDGFNGRHIKNSILSGLANAVLDDREFVRFNDFKSSFLETKDTISSLDQAKPKKGGVTLGSKLKQAIEQKIKEDLNNNTESNNENVDDAVFAE